jgi:hypothetical protein
MKTRHALNTTCLPTSSLHSPLDLSGLLVLVVPVDQETVLHSLVTYLPSPVVQAAQVVPVTVVPVSVVVLAIMKVEIHVRTTNKNPVKVNKEMNTKVLVVVVKKKLTVRPTSKTLACDKHVVVPAPTTLNILRRTSHWRWPAGLSASTSRSSCSLSSTRRVMTQSKSSTTATTTVNGKVYSELTSKV